MLKYGFVGVLILMFLASGTAFARGIIYHGEYQALNNGSVTTRAKATVVLVGFKPKITCTFQLKGSKAPTRLTFEVSECVRRGTHILCSRRTEAATQQKRGWTGPMCWGDTNNKR